VKINYPKSKADLMTCFMEAGFNALIPKGFLGMINLPSWLFLSSFEELRGHLIKKYQIESLLHMGRGIFGVDWGSTAFVISTSKPTHEGKYYKLHKRNFQHIYPDDIKGIFLKAKINSDTKVNFDKYREGDGISSVEEIIDESGLKIAFTANQKDFEKIPGNPIGYWLKNDFFNVLSMSELASARYKIEEGLKTGLNERFIKFWFELDRTHKGDNSNNWTPHTKGGDNRKWYGNNLHFLNFNSSLKEFKGSSIPKFEIDKNYITWGRISSGNISFRFTKIGFIPNMAGLSAYSKKSSNEELKMLCSLGNSKVGQYILNLYNPTLNYPPGVIKKLPIIFGDDTILQVVEDCIGISKIEWDSNEYSFDFQKNSLLRIKENTLDDTLEEIFDLYSQYWGNKFFKLKRNEEELNRFFIENYGLDSELNPEIPLEDITLLTDETRITNNNLVFQKDLVFQKFISFSVGVMFGRYSLDKEGLILANQGETLEDYLRVIEAEVIQSPTFLPDEDNIIPILDDECFEDDIVSRFKEFLRVTFGKENLEKNLAFVESAIGKDIRKYFVKDFYTDHIQRYKKRPIYWMFSSPNGSFNVLIYMHRYTPDTLSKILNDYLNQYREKLRARVEHLDQVMISGNSTEQSKASKEKDKIRTVLLELQEYERDILYPLATERIAITFDEGVLVNYNKFGKAIKEVAGLNDKKTKAKVREFDWIDISTIR
jgi:hypothetical protein